MWKLSLLGQDGGFVGLALLLAAMALGAIALFGWVRVLGLDPVPWDTRFGSRPTVTLGNPNFVGARGTR